MSTLTIPALTISKRNGTQVPFKPELIETAIIRALRSTEEDETLAKTMTEYVLQELSSLPQLSVEVVQDIVENVLMKHGPNSTAKAYILYRHSHEKRRLALSIPEEVESEPEPYYSSYGDLPTSLVTLSNANYETYVVNSKTLNVLFNNMYQNDNPIYRITIYTNNTIKLNIIGTKNIMFKYTIKDDDIIIEKDIIEYELTL